MQRISLVFALVTLFGFSVSELSAAPDEEKSSSQNVFQQLDQNKDGTITADEVPEQKQRFFDILLRSGDQNKDGKLTRSEYETGLKKDDQKFPAGDEGRRGRGGPQFYERFMSQFDRNGDKKISREELPEPVRERMAPLFDRLNTDAISMEQLRNMGNMFGRGRPPRPDANNANAKERSERFFSSLDTNKDGKLTMDEAPERARFILRRIYERSGKEADATLTKEEFMEAVADFRPPQRPGRPEGNRESKRKAGDREMKRPEMQERSEFRPRGDFPLPAFIKTLDTNNDRKLDQAELKQLQGLLEKLDQNDDGYLDIRELMGFSDRMSPRGRTRTERSRRPDSERPRRPEQERSQKDRAEKE